MIMNLAKLKKEYHMDLEYLLETIIKSPMPIVILLKIGKVVSYMLMINFIKNILNLKRILIQF